MLAGVIDLAISPSPSYAILPLLFYASFPALTFLPPSLLFLFLDLFLPAFWLAFLDLPLRENLLRGAKSIAGQKGAGRRWSLAFALPYARSDGAWILWICTNGDRDGE